MLAEARQQAAELDARAKIRLAEGIQAEAAAAGLADVQVRERDAEAIEKVGRAEAAVEREARPRPRPARLRRRRRGEAAGEQVARRGRGSARSSRREAEGLTEKAAAMAALDDATREHEEYRLRLEAEKEIRLAARRASGRSPRRRPRCSPAGLEKANIDIVGGDRVFFDRLVGSITAGQERRRLRRSTPTTAQALAGPYLDGSASLADDLAGVLGSVCTGDVQNLTVSALLMQLIKAGGTGRRRNC